MKTKEERADVYQRITEQIIKAIEQGAENWQMPWHRSQTVPVNAATSKPYRGVNVLTLWAIATQQNYRSVIWATYAQWLELGAQVRQGEKSAFIVFWKFRDQADETEDEQGEQEPATKCGPIARGYNVFNADQVDGFVLPELPTLPPTQRIEAADRFFAGLYADLRHGGSRAYYSPAGDFIQLPEFGAFKEANAYYATLAHESIHNAASGIMPRGLRMHPSTSRKRSQLVGIILTRRAAKIVGASIFASSQSTEGALPMDTPNPLGTYPKQFREQMERQFYTPATVILYDRCLSALNNKMEKLSIDLNDLDEEAAVNLIAKSDLPSCHAIHSRFMVRRFVRFLVAEGAAKPTPKAVPADTELGRLKSAYENYLRRQRGLSDRTIFHSWRIAHRFLTFRFGEELGDLSTITTADIAAFLQQVMTRTPPLRDKTLSSHLRNFFRYLFQAGRTATNLATGILSVAQRYGSRLPRHLTSEEVETLLKAIRTDSLSGRRNYAMVLLIARLGLRAPEVIAVQIDDIDWRAGEILIRGKGKRHDRVPLPPDVGEALTDYIKQDRTTASRTLFVAGRPPHLPFKDGQVLNNILRSAFAKTGLKPPAPYVGSHILRHSLATNLVKLGAALEEIGDMLRHRSRASTMIYAKLDIEGLRSIAQPWPVAGGAR